MAEYIEREELLEHLNDELSCCENPCPEDEPIAYGCKIGLRGAINFVKAMPAADVEEVRHEYWLYDGYEAEYRCSYCGEERPREDAEYCCGCGAKMDGKGENE